MKLDAKAFGLACGLTVGLAGFLGTLLSLWWGSGNTITILAAVYAWYSWSLVGSFVALIWGSVYGFILGWITASAYNRLARS